MAKEQRVPPEGKEITPPADKEAADSAQPTTSYEPDEEALEERGDFATLVRHLRERIKRCEAERAEYLAGWQRSRADFINARKEAEGIREEQIAFATEELILKLIPAVDSFHVAFNNKEVWEKVDLNWRLGIQHIYRQLVDVLRKHGVTLNNPVGEHFNPKEHVIVAVVPTENKAEDGQILAVVQKGYTLHHKVIQPAKVKVGEYRPEAGGSVASAVAP